MRVSRAQTACCVGEITQRPVDVALDQVGGDDGKRGERKRQSDSREHAVVVRGFWNGQGDPGRFVPKMRANPKALLALRLPLNLHARGQMLAQGIDKNI